VCGAIQLNKAILAHNHNGTRNIYCTTTITTQGWVFGRGLQMIYVLNFGEFEFEMVYSLSSWL